MHIPNHMIEGSICPVTAAVSIVGLTTATYYILKSREKPKALSLGAVAAFIFASQMINFPVQNGTSGHLIGATLAASLFGLPFGILLMSIVLTIQTLIFSDGGLSVLGANILSMAIVASIPGGIFYRLTQKNKQKGNYLFFAPVAWISVILAAFVCSLELGISGTVSLLKVLPAMLGIHALIGIGEALITVAAYIIFSEKKSLSSKRKSFITPFIGAGMVSLMVSPFASTYPDGLEWVAEKYNFLHEAAPAFVGPLPDYTVPFISNQIISTGLAGFIGVLTTFFTVWMLEKLAYFIKRIKLLYNYPLK